MPIAYLILETLGNLTNDNLVYYSIILFQVCLFIAMSLLHKKFKYEILTIIIYNLYLIATSFVWVHISPKQSLTETIIFGLTIIYIAERRLHGYRIA